MYIDPIGQRVDANELNHHGVLGMKWGIRRFQPYPDGYRGDGKYVGPNAQKDFAENIKQLAKSTSKYARKGIKYRPQGYDYSTGEVRIATELKNKRVKKANAIYKQKLDEEVGKRIASNPKLKKSSERLSELLEKYDLYEPEMNEYYEIKNKKDAAKLRQIKKEMVNELDNFVNEMVGSYGNVTLERIVKISNLDKTIRRYATEHYLVYTDPTTANEWGEGALDKKKAKELENSRIR